MTTLADVIAVLDRLYNPAWAESWDAVGLVTGDPEQEVRRILFAVDPMRGVIDEAIDGGFDLLVTHHPLLLRGVNSVAATTPKGRVIHDLIRRGVALHVCHTNADNANPGVSDALAAALGLRDTRPLKAMPAEPMDKVVVFVPVAETQAMLDALAKAGAGQIGDYERAAWSGTGEGTFRPLAGANPAIGTVGDIEVVPENRIEMVLPRRKRRAVVEALVAAHSYEEPAYDIYEVAALPSERGGGRVGVLAEPLRLAEFADSSSRRACRGPSTVFGCPGTSTGRSRPSRWSGERGTPSSTGSARQASTPIVTADLRHHPGDRGSRVRRVRRWSTSRTGPASGRGSRRRPPPARGWQRRAVPWTLTSQRSAPTPGPSALTVSAGRS